MRAFDDAYEGAAQVIHNRYIRKLAITRFYGVFFALIIIIAAVFSFLVKIEIYIRAAVVVGALYLLIWDIYAVIRKQRSLKNKEFIHKILPALYDISREKMSFNEINDSNLMRLKAGSTLEYHGTLSVDVDYHKFKVHDITITTSTKNADGSPALIYEGGLFISTPEEFPCRVKIEPDMKQELEAISLGVEATELQKELMNMNVFLTSKMKNIMVELKPMEVEGPFRVYTDDAESAARLVDVKYLKRLAEQPHKISVYFGYDKFYVLVHDVHFINEHKSIRDSYDRVYKVVKKLELLLPFDRN